MDLQSTAFADLLLTLFVIILYHITTLLSRLIFIFRLTERKAVTFLQHLVPLGTCALAEGTGLEPVQP